MQSQSCTLGVCTSSPANLSPVSGNHFDTFFEGLSTFSAEPCSPDAESGARTYRCVHLPGTCLTSWKPAKPNRQTVVGSTFFQNFPTTHQAIEWQLEMKWGTKTRLLAPLLVPRPFWLSAAHLPGVGRRGFYMSWGGGIPGSLFVQSEGLDSLAVSSPVPCDCWVPALHVGSESSDVKGLFEGFT